MLNVDLHDMLKGGISRYELVAATAKRARQIVDEVAHSNDNISDVTAKHKLYERSEAECGELLDKAVSIAVSEYLAGDWDIIPDETVPGRPDQAEF